ncbi:hypothetical protein QM012_008478 [Aureobasidium pullulans]|uniref:Uncharacterized protein n=1 Tax=Aureobasidium pullulans TaxID=5580 RepID=A0ABR0TKK0_AURPU
MDPTASPLPPPMTTRQKARDTAQAAKPGLKYLVVPPILETTEPHGVEVKKELREKFDNLCEEAGWAPTDAIRDELRILTKLDTNRKQRDCEAALFAFVQHLDFVWMNGYVLLGRKKFEEGILCVWYRPLYTPTERRIEFCYGPRKTIFKPMSLSGRVDKDKVWPPFTKLFDLTCLSRDKQNLYLTGVWEILNKFKHMRGILDPNGFEDEVSRPGHPELPFLPENQNTKLRSRLRSQSLDELNMDNHVDNQEATHATSTRSSDGAVEHQSRSSTDINDTSCAHSIITESSSRIDLEGARTHKRKATGILDGSPSRKQAHFSNADDVELARCSKAAGLQSLSACYSANIPQSHDIRKPSSVSEPLLIEVERPALSDQRSQSDAGSQSVREAYQERETQRKITTMFRSSSRAHTIEPQSTIDSGRSVNTRVVESLEHSIITAETSELPQQPSQDRYHVSGLLKHLLQSVEVTSFVDTTSNEARLQIVAHLPAKLFHSPALKFSPVVWLDILPVLPSRECIIWELEKIAISTVNAQQRDTQQQNSGALPRSPAIILAAPVVLMTHQRDESSSDSGVTVDRVRKLLHGPRAKLISSGKEKDGGLELFSFAFTFPSATIENRSLDFSFTRVRSKETSPVKLTKSQAFSALAEYAREDEES